MWCPKPLPIPNNMSKSLDTLNNEKPMMLDIEILNIANDNQDNIAISDALPSESI